MLIRVLLAADPLTVRRRVSRLLDGSGVEVTAVPVKTQLWERLSHEEFELVVLAAGDGAPPVSLISAIRALPDRPEIVVLRPREDGEERARLLASGCLAVLWLGLPDSMLAETLGVLLVRRRDDVLRRLREARPDDPHSLNAFAFPSPVMQRFLPVARRVVESDSALLILGETGVGKERLARAIHAESRRGAGPFLAVNCGALADSLLESELFGHEEGAFTGASRVHRGYFEMAHRGTIFLDEIGEMPLHMQVKLLRVLEDRQVRRVGGEQSRRVDVRVVAATNRDLEADLKTKRFRSDLFFRLAVVTLTLPPLRDRPEDIPVLARHYLELLRAGLGRPAMTITDRALDALVARAWPGNIRELINVIERAVLLSHGTELDVIDLLPPSDPISEPEATPRNVVDPAWFDLPLIEARQVVTADFELAYLKRHLAASGGRIAAAATRMGINPRTLFDLMQRHSLRKESFKTIP